MTHTHTKTAVLVVIAVLLCVLIATAADAPITFKFSPVKIPGAQASWAYGVNNSGVIVGQYFDANSVGHGFKLNQQGRWTKIDPPDSTWTICYGINSTGAIVGEYTATSGSNHGFLYKNGKYTEIGGGAQSGAFGINDKGKIVGSYLTDAFVWDGQNYTQLKVPGAQITEGVRINNQGVIALIALDPGQPARSYLYQRGKYTEVKVPGATQTYLYDINNLGDLILTWDDQRGIHGDLRQNGKFYKFDYTRNYTYAYGLNDYQLIVGDSFTSTAFKATFSTSVTTNPETQ